MQVVAEQTHTPGRPWSVADAAEYIGVSDRHFWKMINTGIIKSIRIGKRVFIPDAELQRIANEGTGEANEPK